jgi:hypothetical protein
MTDDFKIGDFVKFKEDSRLAYLDYDITLNRDRNFFLNRKSIKIIDIDKHQFLELDGIDGRIFNPSLFEKDIAGLRKEKLKRINGINL